MGWTLRTTALVGVVSVGIGLTGNLAARAPSGAIHTTTEDGTAVNWNIYSTSADVYISGGPQNRKAAGLPDGTYFFQVTDPSGKILLSTDDAVCRQLTVVSGRIAGATGGACQHSDGTFNPANGTTPVQLAPFSATPNPGGVYKAWLIPAGSAIVSGADPKVLGFTNASAKTDNFKVSETIQPPVGSCQPSSSLSVMNPTGTADVVSYVPKGSWSYGTTGIAVVSVEGSPVLPTTNPISTAAVVNSCASNSATGQTVCTANTNSVYVIDGLAAVPTVTTLLSSGSGTVSFSGGSATNTGVTMDALNNRVAIGLSIAGVKGFQILNLATSTFEAPFASPAGDISEDPLIDPVRNLLLSASYASGGNYEIVDVANSTSPSFYENVVGGGSLDSSGEDCSTGIALAPAEFSGPSNVVIANLSSSAATFTPGSPGTWTAPGQIQSLSESFLSAGASGLAVAQGTHVGVVSGEFGGNAITAIALPTTLDTSATVPAIGDWVTCSIPGFSNGYDPHTVTAYRSPADGHAIALLANGTATALARVDLTMMFDTTVVPRTGGGHACVSGSLPVSVFSLIAVP